MARDNEMTKDERDFASAWGEENGAPEQEVGTSDTGTDAGPAEPAVAEAAVAADSADAGQPVDAPAAAEEAAAAADPDAPADPKEAQQERSWRGRLDARERELAAREAKLKEAEASLKKNPEAAAEVIKEVADKADAEGDTELAAAADDAAEKVEDGRVSVKEALGRLTEDFGTDFVEMMTVIFRDIARQEADLIADGKTRESVSALEQRVADGFRSIGERHMLLHREKIEESFPDLEDIVGSEAFQSFMKTYPDGEQIASGGTARQIIKMLKAFKAAGGDDGTQDAGKNQIGRDAQGAHSAVAQAQPSEAAIDAAAGVRSGGRVSLPASPKESGDYVGAWAEA